MCLEYIQYSSYSGGPCGSSNLVPIPLQAVELENSSPRKVTKHLVLVVTNGYQDTEEAIVLGTEQEDSV